MNRPKLPTMGDTENPASIADLRGARAVTALLLVADGALLLWLLLADGPTWACWVLGIAGVILAVGLVSLHGQLHGWDAPETADDADHRPW